eukprot:TRINITY_DN5492_c0_g1_i1.p1 TRINITY_DN5492_c0_g1~~TRINITY_DN5492_c0_g1_i1.p1  ORF type:complete len:235 (+),score=72.37 TRINITY_DN5492_c0_g1_i1:90-794(+)
MKVRFKKSVRRGMPPEERPPSPPLQQASLSPEGERVRAAARARLAEAVKALPPPAAAAASAALEQTLFERFYNADRNEAYRRKLAAMRQELTRSAVLADVYHAACAGDAATFARRYFAEPALLVPAAAAATQATLRRDLIDEAEGDLGGKYTSGVCQRCMKQVLPLWAECHSHWGTTCDRDNCCQCPPEPAGSDDDDGAPAPKKRRTAGDSPTPPPDPKPDPKPKVQLLASSFF